MIFHILAFATGYLIDLLIGDPYWMPHPIRAIGKLIAFLDKLLMGKEKLPDKRDYKKELRRGRLLCLIVILVTGLVTSLVLAGSYIINVYLGLAVEAILTAYILATKSLKKESMKVFYALEMQDTKGARLAVSMIVGRDTSLLDEEGIAKAAVETVAENTSDGVIAPMLYTCLGGPVAGLIYKAINTMDSMVGYHNDRYEYFGRTAARLDDLVNYLPARISAMYMLGASYVGGSDFNTDNAVKIYHRDRYNHKSPNSAQTESVCAGALQVRLAGDASYFGKLVKKPYIGDEIRAISYLDIKRVNRLMYLSAFLCFVDCIILLVIIRFVTILLGG